MSDPLEEDENEVGQAELDELFGAEAGSDTEEELGHQQATTPGAPAPATPGATTPAGATTPVGLAPGTPGTPIDWANFSLPGTQIQGGADVDDITEEALFGDALQASEADLFGTFSDDEDAAASAPAPLALAEGAIQEPTQEEAGEADAAASGAEGEDSEEDEAQDGLQETAHKHTTQVRPPRLPGSGTKMVVFRLPNTISVDHRAFNPSTFDPADTSVYRENQGIYGRSDIKLRGAENCIRWRFKRDANGAIEYDEDGHPKQESNARVVEWSDGSKQLFIGNNPYDLGFSHDPVHLFESSNNAGDLHVSFGVVQEKLQAYPTHVESSVHERLKNAQFNKVQKHVRTRIEQPRERGELMESNEKDKVILTKVNKKIAEDRKKRLADQQSQALQLEVGDGSSAAGAETGERNAKRAKQAVIDLPQEPVALSADFLEDIFGDGENQETSTGGGQVEAEG